MWPNENEPGLFGPCGLNWPDVINDAVSGFMSNGDCGPIDKFWSNVKPKNKQNNYLYKKKEEE